MSVLICNHMFINRSGSTYSFSSKISLRNTNLAGKKGKEYWSLRIQLIGFVMNMLVVVFTLPLQSNAKNYDNV